MSSSKALADVVIAVSGIHRGASPQPGGAVVSSLRRLVPDIRVIGLCYDPMESGIYSNDIDRIDRAFLFPYPDNGPEALLKRLDEIILEERIDLIVPCLDSEIENFIAIEADLADRGIKVCLPSLQSFEDRDKKNLAEFCKQTGVPSPKTYAANDAAQLATFTAEIGFPCYVKGRLYGAKRVYNLSQLYQAFDEIFGVWGGPVLLQEIVIGEEFNLVGVGDGQGRIIGHTAIRKLLRTRLGKGFGGVVVEDPAIVELAEKIIRELRWNGPFELEFLKSPGRPHFLFEMNPRFPSWVDFPTQTGCNLPLALVEMALNLPISDLAVPPAGRMFLRHCADIVTDIADIARIGTGGDTDSSNEIGIGSPT